MFDWDEFVKKDHEAQKYYADVKAGRIKNDTFTSHCAWLRTRLKSESAIIREQAAIQLYILEHPPKDLDAKIEEIRALMSKTASVLELQSFRNQLEAYLFLKNYR